MIKSMAERKALAPESAIRVTIKSGLAAQSVLVTDQTTGRVLPVSKATWSMDAQKRGLAVCTLEVLCYDMEVEALAQVRTTPLWRLILQLVSSRWAHVLERRGLPR